MSREKSRERVRSSINRPPAGGIPSRNVGAYANLKKTLLGRRAFLFIHNMQPKHLIFVLIAFTLFGGGFAYVTAPTLKFVETYSEETLVQDIEFTDSKPQEKTVTRALSSQSVTVSAPSEVGISIEPTAFASDATIYTIPVLSNTTVLEAMRALATLSNFSFSGNDFTGLGLFVDEINGLKNASGYYWTLFVNDELSQAGASSAKVVPGDIVEWRYQKGI